MQASITANAQFISSASGNSACACSVARTVDPKRKKVAESEKNLRLAQKELARIKVRVLNSCQPMHCHTRYLQEMLCVVTVLMHHTNACWHEARPPTTVKHILILIPETNSM